MSTFPCSTRMLVAVSAAWSASPPANTPRLRKASPQFWHSRSGTAWSLSVSRYTRQAYFIVIGLLSQLGEPSFEQTTLRLLLGQLERALEGTPRLPRTAKP